jgi:hypothetical protein
MQEIVRLATRFIFIILVETADFSTTTFLPVSGKVPLALFPRLVPQTNIENKKHVQNI